MKTKLNLAILMLLTVSFIFAQERVSTTKKVKAKTEGQSIKVKQGETLVYSKSINNSNTETEINDVDKGKLPVANKRKKEVVSDDKGTLPGANKIKNKKVKPDNSNIVKPATKKKSENLKTQKKEMKRSVPKDINSDKPLN